MSNNQSRFVWYDLMTNDLQAAQAFYKEVIGWSAADSGLPDRTYSILSMGETMVGGMMPIPPDMSGATPCWIGYIGVDNVDVYAEKVKSAGGTITRPPQNIPTVGRFAVATDPHHATFILFQGPDGQQAPPPAGDEPGRVGWNELHAGDWETDWAFYSELFGWEKEMAVDMGAMGTYQCFGTGGTGGGMMTKMPQTPGPFWLFYFNVDAVDAAVERIKGAGGMVVMGPHEVPGGAWIVQGLDPQGALFAVTSRTR